MKRILFSIFIFGLHTDASPQVHKVSTLNQQMVWKNVNVKDTTYYLIDGIQNGIYKLYYEDTTSDKLASEFEIIDKKKEGKYMYWHRKGKLKFESNYVAGLLHGKKNEWYDNGQKKFEGNYINGLNDGVFIEWYKNGNKLFEGKFINGNEEGIHTNWLENGLKFSELGPFTKGVIINGYFKEWYVDVDVLLNFVSYEEGSLVSRVLYYKNGQKKAEFDFTKSQEDPQMRFWNQEGKEINEEEFQNIFE